MGCVDNCECILVLVLFCFCMMGTVEMGRDIGRLWWKLGTMGIVEDTGLRDIANVYG